MRTKKSSIKFVFASAIALAVSYGVYTSQQSIVIPDLAMANVEALANEEYVIGTTGTNWKTYHTQCTIVVGFDYVLKIEKSTTYWADVCGSGIGLCLSPAGC